MITKHLFAATVAAAIAVPAAAADQLTPPTYFLPAGSPEAATWSTGGVSPGDLAVHEYFYIQFPRCVEQLDYDVRLAELEVAYLVRRVNSYRPFRSAGRYATTYFVDQATQLDLIAAERRLQQLRYAQADLWRERRLAAEALLAK